VDSVTLTLRLDPEDLNLVFDRYLAACDSIVSAHGGQVMQYMGDGVLAYFGYAGPADTDAANAVRAARQLRDALGQLSLPAGVTLRSRIGVVSSWVVVGDVTAHGNGILGETPHLASRLQAFGQPDMVIVCDTTRHLAGDSFAFRPMGVFHPNGFPDPVTAFEAL
jgi:class 3 adenylate cyclase